MDTRSAMTDPGPARVIPRVVPARDGTPVAAAISPEDPLALEESDAAEDAHWERVAQEAIAVWEAEGCPLGTSHEGLLARHGMIPLPE